MFQKRPLVPMVTFVLDDLVADFARLHYWLRMIVDGGSFVVDLAILSRYR